MFVHPDAGSPIDVNAAANLTFMRVHSPERLQSAVWAVQVILFSMPYVNEA